MSDYDIHSCGYYCDRHACIVAQRNELRDKLFSNQAVKTYSGGKPNYTQPIEQEPVLRGTDYEAAFYKDWNAGKVRRVSDGKIMGEPEPTLDGWPLYSGLPPPSIPAIKVQDKSFEEFAQSFAQRPQYDPRREPSGSWTSWDNTMCNPLADARMQTQSAWQDGYDSAKAERVIDKSMAKRIATQLGWEPKKEWVGLTDEERANCSAEAYGRHFVLCELIEAKLKEKNT
jgi:hypothetical protein